MAAIDKIYLPKEQGILFYNWAKEVNNKCEKDSGYKLVNYFYDFEEFESDCPPITNTPTGIDRWLILNCPFDFVHEQLKFQYDDFYDDVLNGTDEYSTPYIYEKSTKLKISNDYGSRHQYNLGFYPYWVQIMTHDENNNWWYNKEEDRWVNEAKELYPTHSNTSHFGRSIKSVIRKIRKWGLPKGIELKVSGRRIIDTFTVITK